MNGKELESTRVTITCNKRSGKHKKLQVRMIIMASKRLQKRLKRKKNCMMVMFVWMKAANAYLIQRVNARAQHKRRPPVKKRYCGYIQL